MFRNSPVHRAGRWAVAGALGTLLVVASAWAETLTVYSAVEAEDLKKYAQQFNQDYPGIEIKWIRDSTGVITDRLLAEKDNPQADAIWGLAASSLLLLKREDMLLPYAPVGLERVDPLFRDKAEPPLWVGMDAWEAAVCFNTQEAAKHNLPKPTSWKDLTDAVYQGHIVMPNAVSSGTGFLAVSSWLQLFGEIDGWLYMDKLDRNIKHYTHSGSKPCEQAASGEVAIGISFAFRGAKEKDAGAPIDVILPSEGVGWDMEATAIIKGTKKLKAAQTLADWSVSPKAMRMYNEGYAIIAIPELARPVKNMPPNVLQAMLFSNDFEWAAVNRKRILSKWEASYGSRSEPKS